jgi:transcriptional regulator GlxA family with amidase domain
MQTIAFVLFDGAEELDFAGPWEVLAYLARTEPETCRVLTVSQRGGIVRCAKGLRVVADHSFADCPPFEIMLVPGGIGTRTEVDNPVLIAFLHERGRRCTLVTSVCTGAFLLERAGLLAPRDGRPRRATTHWASIERLRALGSVEVVSQRFVDTGDVITAAGVSAGIDMALHLVARLWGEETARRVQKGIEYYPALPLAAPTAGG